MDYFFVAYDSIEGSNITREGSSISANSIANGIGLQRIDSTSFRFVYNSQYGAIIQWVPFYSGYTYPSGGTLSGSTCTIDTTATAQGICPSGYTMNNFQCIQD